MHKMSTSDFYYDLPEELIAQTPVEPRSASRMMTLDRRSGKVGHSHFYNLCSFLKKGDLLVLNDSRVLPARIYGENFQITEHVAILFSAGHNFDVGPHTLEAVDGPNATGVQIYVLDEEAVSLRYRPDG